MTTTKQLIKKANKKLSQLQLKLVGENEGLKVVIIYSVENLDLYRCQETSNHISHIEKLIRENSHLNSVMGNYYFY